MSYALLYEIDLEEVRYGAEHAETRTKPWVMQDGVFREPYHLLETDCHPSPWCRQ